MSMSRVQSGIGNVEELVNESCDFALQRLVRQEESVGRRKPLLQVAIRNVLERVGGRYRDLSWNIMTHEDENDLWISIPEVEPHVLFDIFDSYELYLLKNNLGLTIWPTNIGYEVESEVAA